ncbi:MAG: hypothetical protein GY746_10835 [Gammaproteobacteria bacterium]|nr:hypothetical protein [Gammaproteobacteria bacterium]
MQSEYTKAQVLMHRIFQQTDAGRDLLEEFKDSLMKVPADNKGPDPFYLGMEEGRKQFIRNIILTIEQIEGKPNE